MLLLFYGHVFSALAWVHCLVFLWKGHYLWPLYRWHQSTHLNPKYTGYPWFHGQDGSFFNTSTFDHLMTREKDASEGIGSATPNPQSRLNHSSSFRRLIKSFTSLVILPHNGCFSSSIKIHFQNSC